MIVDRYEPVNLFAVIPQRYATLEPVLQELDLCWLLSSSGH
jgi:hypothetical protein